MPGPANGGRTGGKSYNKKDNAMLDNLRDACPPHRTKDLDKLVKSLNGNEEKIRQKIQEWWEEPAKEEEVWEDVNKKNAKKKPQAPAFRGGGERGGGGGARSQGPGRGRGYGRSAGGGGRGGGGRDCGGRTGERGRGGPPKREKDQKMENGTSDDDGTTTPASQPGVPVPVTTAPALKGAWGARAAASTVPSAGPSTSSEAPKKAPQPKPEDNAVPPEENPLEIGIPSQSDPTPSGIALAESKPVRTAVPPSGNVWATKGSAHLIQAEKPKPPAPVAPPVSAPSAPIVKPPKPVEPEPTPLSPPEPTLESGLPSSVTAGNAWVNQPTPPLEPEPSPLEISPPSPIVSQSLSASIPSVASVEDPVPVSPVPKVAPPPPLSPAAPANVLNMGHWETGDETQNLDFGFGSFGADNDDIVANKSVPSPGQQEADSAAASAVSPARPPPGLSLGGMPPMPESAVMVHELENKMESASLSAAQKEQVEPKPITSSLPTQPVQVQENVVPTPVLQTASVTQQSYSQYGMPGMYNYSAAGSGFVGMTPAGPVLAGVPQPGKPAGGLGQTNVTGPAAGALPQQGLYGAHPPPAPSSGNAITDTNTDNTATAPNTAAGIPPGMPGAIPYANPALQYGHHQFYMGQHQGGIGYNYGYGQFGGVAQGGFGYQQVMGQTQGYGAPHYDDHTQQATSHHTGATGGYQKNSGGGYRGRNNHHSNNQYQNQYNPQQHGGYGAQPYGMGYHGDHFSQRGGYGPGGMGDPYGMQQGMHSGGFQDDDHQKGKKGGRGNNSSLQQFQQQGPPHQLGAQQPFGLQGQGSETTPSTGAGGWSNQGGWSGGAPSWQGS